MGKRVGTEGYVNGREEGLQRRVGMGLLLAVSWAGTAIVSFVLSPVLLASRSDWYSRWTERRQREFRASERKRHV